MRDLCMQFCFEKVKITKSAHADWRNRRKTPGKLRGAINRGGGEENCERVSYTRGHVQDGGDRCSV